MDFIFGLLGLAIGLGLPGFLGFLAVVWAISSLISGAVESGVRRGNREERGPWDW